MINCLTEHLEEYHPRKIFKVVCLTEFDAELHGVIQVFGEHLLVYDSADVLVIINLIAEFDQIHIPQPKQRTLRGILYFG